MTIVQFAKLRKKDYLICSIDNNVCQIIQIRYIRSSPRSFCVYDFKYKEEYWFDKEQILPNFFIPTEAQLTNIEILYGSF